MLEEKDTNATITSPRFEEKKKEDGERARFQRRLADRFTFLSPDETRRSARQRDPGNRIYNRIGQVPKLTLAI